PDAHEAFVGECAERNASARELPPALADLVRDRVLARSLGDPRGGAPVAARPFLQLPPALDVERVDLFGSVDLSKPLELVRDESAIDDAVALAQVAPSACSSAAAPPCSTGCPCETSTSSTGSAASRRRRAGLSSRSGHPGPSLGSQSISSSRRSRRAIQKAPPT